jgi:hypothetical protein
MASMAAQGRGLLVSLDSHFEVHDDTPRLAFGGRDVNVIFWILGVFSIAAALLAVVPGKALRSIQGVTALMVVNSAILLLLHAWVLAAVLFGFNLAAAAVAWTVLRRTGGAKLATPGRVRFGIAKFGALVMVGLLTAVLIRAVFKSAALGAAPAGPSAAHWVSGVLLAGFLLINAGITTLFLVRARRREPGEAEGSAEAPAPKGGDR